MPVRLPPFRFSWPPTCQWLLAFNRYLYNRCVFVFRGIPHGGVVLVSVICASFEETLAPVKQTLSAFRGCALLVRRRPSNVYDLFTRRFTSRTVFIFVYATGFFYETRLEIRRATRIALARACISYVILATSGSRWSFSRNSRSRSQFDTIRSSIAIDTIR